VARGAPGPLTSEVLLRDMTEGDLPIFSEEQLDPDANRGRLHGQGPGGLGYLHGALDRDPGRRDHHKKTILFDGHVAGNIVSFEKSGEREVGYWIGRKYWGKGVATRALSTFLGHVKKRPLYAHVAKDNIASNRVLEKCGFKISGEDRGDAKSGREKRGTIIPMETCGAASPQEGART
jgi:hypothetical protein